MTATQLTLGFAAAPPSLARADFIAAASNEAALTWLEAWRDWPTGRLCLFGPPGSGRSHLAAVFAGLADAAPIAAGALTLASVPHVLPPHGRVVLDDGDAVTDERALLHLLNLAAECGGRVLLTGRAAPARWQVALPDLRSRLAASPAVGLGIPDQALLRAVLAKGAAERQLHLAPALLDWLAARLPRNLAAAASAIAALDQRILASNRRPGPNDAAAALAQALLRDQPDEITMTGPGAPCPPAGPLL